jgi:hypothetical protein
MKNIQTNRMRSKVNLADKERRRRSPCPSLQVRARLDLRHRTAWRRPKIPRFRAAP